MRAVHYHAALAILFGATVAYAQVGIPFPGPGGVVAGGAPAGPFTFIAHQMNFGDNPNSPLHVDCTGANFLVVVQSRFPSAANVAPTDSGTNTYTQVGTEATNGTSNVSLWISTGSPSVSASFNWGDTIPGQFSTIMGACFSDGSTSSLDKHAQADNANQPGSVTPSVNNELVVTGFVPPNGGSGTPTISAGFTITDAKAVVGGTTVGGGLAYQIQTTATAVNPTWSTSGGGTGGSIIGTFK